MDFIEIFDVEWLTWHYNRRQNKFSEYWSNERNLINVDDLADRIINRLRKGKLITAEIKLEICLRHSNSVFGCQELIVLGLYRRREQRKDIEVVLNRLSRIFPQLVKYIRCHK